MLVNETPQPGTYDVTRDASNYASGVYFYRIESGDFEQSKKDGDFEINHLAPLRRS